jgi:hypothetical protein
MIMLLNAAFSASAVPKEWCSTHLSVIFKKGDPSVLDNYRGIAVGTVLGKVFSLVLHARLFNWSESVGCRAAGQAGFRDGYRTSDHVFVLKHLVDRIRAPGSPHKRLYSCFVDFGGGIVTRRHVRSQQEWHCLPRWEPTVKDRC